MAYAMRNEINQHKQCHIANQSPVMSEAIRSPQRNKVNQSNYQSQNEYSTIRILQKETNHKNHPFRMTLL